VVIRTRNIPSLTSTFNFTLPYLSSPFRPSSSTFWPLLLIGKPLVDGTVEIGSDEPRTAGLSGYHSPWLSAKALTASS
jgi:hypothetical protein